VGKMNRQDSEIAKYFRSLLDHQSHCTVANCQSCAGLKSILELVRERMFATVLFTDDAEANRVRVNAMSGVTNQSFASFGLGK
jgi:hypothetical protein